MVRHETNSCIEYESLTLGEAISVIRRPGDIFVPSSIMEGAQLRVVKVDLLQQLQEQIDEHGSDSPSYLAVWEYPDGGKVVLNSNQPTF